MFAQQDFMLWLWTKRYCSMVQLLNCHLYHYHKTIKKSVSPSPTVHVLDCHDHLSSFNVRVVRPRFMTTDMTKCVMYSFSIYFWVAFLVINLHTYSNHRHWIAMTTKNTKMYFSLIHWHYHLCIHLIWVTQWFKNSLSNFVKVYF